MMPLLFSLCLMMLLFSPAHGETYMVHPDGSGDFPTIQGAITAAQDGDVIVLADGVFTGEGNRDIDLLGKAVTVRSLSGEPTACVVDCGASAGDPHRGFLFLSGEGAATMLESISVTRGYAPSDHVAASGGAVLCPSASLPMIPPPST